MWFCNIFKVPALLEGQAKEKACSDSEDAGSSGCSDTDSEEREDQACSRKSAADIEVDKKVSRGCKFPCSSAWQQSQFRFSLLKISLLVY